MAHRPPYCPHCGGRLDWDGPAEEPAACPHCGGSLRDASQSEPATPSHDTPARPLSPGEKMLRDFQARQAQGHHGGRRRAALATAVAGAALLAAIVLLAVLRRPKPHASVPPPPLSTKVGTGTPDPDERNAAVLFRRTQRAADLKQWASVLKHLDELMAKYAETRFMADHATAIAALRAKAEEELKGTVVVVKPPDPLKPPVPVATVDDALRAWPVAFEDTLADKACLERAWLFRGQYGGHFHIHGGGLAISGVHTHSALWWQRPVGDQFALSVEFRFAGGVPCIWLNGPGYGTGLGLGYVIRLPVENHVLNVELRRHGALLGLPLRRPHFVSNTWHRLDVVRLRECLALWLDGEKLGEWGDPEPLAGALHAFVGLGAQWGLWGNERPHYRHLALRMPQAEADRLAAETVERVFDAPITALSTPTGDLLFADEFAEDGLSRWAGTKPEWGVHRREAGLVLSGPNAWPRPWRTDPLRGDFALELPMHYFADREAVNFSVSLRFGEFINAREHKFHGWRFSFATGDGVVALDWHDELGNEQRMAATAYFAPTHGRPYLLRIERIGQRLRAFANGGFLVEAAAPDQTPPTTPVYVGFRQIYGGSVVKRLRAWAIPEVAPAGLPPGMPVVGIDYGPRLAADGSYWAAFQRDVCPLLADRAYDQATKVADALGQRPEFRLAAELAHLSRSDVARLARLWATVGERVAALPEDKRPDLAQAKAQDILALLGPDFPPDAESRLQAALFLLFDRHGDPRRAIDLLGPIADTEEARRYGALARRVAPPQE